MLAPLALPTPDTTKYALYLYLYWYLYLYLPRNHLKPSKINTFQCMSPESSENKSTSNNSVQTFALMNSLATETTHWPLKQPYRSFFLVNGTRCRGEMQNAE